MSHRLIERESEIEKGKYQRKTRWGNIRKNERAARLERRECPIRHSDSNP